MVRTRSGLSLVGSRLTSTSGLVASRSSWTLQNRRPLTVMWSPLTGAQVPSLVRSPPTSREILSSVGSPLTRQQTLRGEKCQNHSNRSPGSTQLQWMQQPWLSLTQIQPMQRHPLSSVRTAWMLGSRGLMLSSVSGTLCPWANTASRQSSCATLAGGDRRCHWTGVPRPFSSGRTCCAMTSKRCSAHQSKGGSTPTTTGSSRTLPCSFTRVAGRTRPLRGVWSDCALSWLGAERAASRSTWRAP
mmetsp:Transcript_12286/g.28827  ORF Transcript_12286/g.28827 Transcript_12286/m.28827 type:complete len:244 (-) Transcript_12286:815-1546(-)